MTQVCWPACCFALLALIKSPLSLALCASWSAWFDQEISLSMYIYIYIYICLYLCWLQDWCKVDGTEESRSAGLHVLGQLHCVPCCLCLVKSACVELCVLLSSSGLSLSLCIYIYTWCRIGSFILQNGAKLMAKTMQVCWPACAWPVHSVPCCVCLVKSASVELCVLLSSSGLSLSLYIYIYMLGAGSAPSSCRMVQS